VRTILVGLGAAAGTFVLTAIILTVVDLYLAGHGRPSPRQLPFLVRGSVHLSVADAIALGLSAGIGALAMVWHARQR